MTYLFVISMIVLIMGLVLWLISYVERRKLGSVSKDMVYQDSVEYPGMTLRSKRLRLVGRPDFIVRNGEQYIPIEFKSGHATKYPYKNHVMQLAAYCLLVEEKYGVRPDHGIVRYPEKEFEVPFTPYLEVEVLKVIDDIIEAKATNIEYFCKHEYHNIQKFFFKTLVLG